MIPPHLAQYIARQKYENYSSMDHASWRYIMRVSRRFFKEHAHSKYLSGLDQTGIETEKIPRISTMSKKLKRFGWKAVPVTGFIPPSVFLEFLSLSILPIACDIRRLEHLEYTPSPDIVHEAAGHAPIISDRQFANYLHNFGEIARKAIFAQEDLEVYEAVKYLSDLKESTAATEVNIAEAYERLNRALKNVTYTSEASKLSRLGWWSTEYGLIKTKKDFKIYGAGLLSSVGESYSFFAENVPHRELTIECVNVNYDITKPQPQLFYIESFAKLKKVIDQLANQLSYKLGGLEGLARAKRAQTVNTVVLENGLQMSGALAAVHTLKLGEIGSPWQTTVDHVFDDQEKALDRFGSPVYLQFTGPTQLSFGDKELKGHSGRYHAHGYGTPIGRVMGFGKTASHLTARDLASHGFYKNHRGRLEFESGVVVEGILKKVLKKKVNGKKPRKHFRNLVQNLVLTFSDCTVFRGDIVLFQPEWGPFDMACGADVISVFGGAADRIAYGAGKGKLKPQARAQASTVTKENRGLLPFYKKIREIREQRSRAGRRKAVGYSVAVTKELCRIGEELRAHYPKEWLIRLEMLEVLASARKAAPEIAKLDSQLKAELVRIGHDNPTVGTLIRRGLELI